MMMVRLNVIDLRNTKCFIDYLSLQEDEVELANPLFRELFNDLINFYLQNEILTLNSI
jgi:DNA primase